MKWNWQMEYKNPGTIEKIHGKQKDIKCTVRSSISKYDGHYCGINYYKDYVLAC